MADLKQSAKQTLDQLDLDSLRKNLSNVDMDKVRNALGLSNVDLADLHKREDEAAAKGFIGGFLLGIIIGGILALVFAPKRGDETRGMVMDKASDLVHQVRGDDQGTAAEAAIEREFGPAVDQTQSQFAQVPEDIGSEG